MIRSKSSLALVLTLLGGGIAATQLPEPAIITVETERRGLEFAMIANSPETYGGAFRTPTTLEVDQPDLAAVFVSFDQSADLRLHFRGAAARGPAFDFDFEGPSSVMGLSFDSEGVLLVSPRPESIAAGVASLRGPLYIHFGHRSRASPTRPSTASSRTSGSPQTRSCPKWM